MNETLVWRHPNSRKLAMRGARRRLVRAERAEADPLNGYRVKWLVVRGENDSGGRAIEW